MVSVFISPSTMPRAVLNYLLSSLFCSDDMETVRFSFNGSSPFPQLACVLGLQNRQLARYLATDIQCTH